MNYYSAYGVTIESAFDLPELLSTDRSSAEVSFRRGDVEPVSESVEKTMGFRVRAEPRVARLTYDSIGTFLVEAGERVTFDPVAAEILDDVAVRRLFENEMMGLLLHQRGNLVLHASAVSVDGKAVVFLGQRGAGKSTTAAAFLRDGYDVFEDDTLAVRFEEGVPTVVPGVPQLRIRPSVAEALGFDSSTQCVATPQSEKIHIPLDGIPDPAPLARCYLLQRGGRLGFEDLSLSETFFGLLSQTFARGLLNDTDATGDHFQQCTDIIDSAVIRTLTYPDRFAELSSLVELVVEDVRTAGKTDH